MARIAREMALIKKTITALTLANVRTAVNILAARATTKVVHSFLSTALIKPLSWEE